MLTSQWSLTSNTHILMLLDSPWGKEWFQKLWSHRAKSIIITNRLICSTDTTVVVWMVEVLLVHLMVARPTNMASTFIENVHSWTLGANLNIWRDGLTLLILLLLLLMMSTPSAHRPFRRPGLLSVYQVLDSNNFPYTIAGGSIVYTGEITWLETNIFRNRFAIAIWQHQNCFRIVQIVN